MKILKFGGKSLANGKGIQTVVDIIEKRAKSGEAITVVLSARGASTNELEEILVKASRNESYKAQLEAFKQYQLIADTPLDTEKEFHILDTIFEGVSLLGDYSEKIKDKVLSQGELLAARLVTQLLKNKGVNAHFTDSRSLIITDDQFGNAQPLDSLSKKNVQQHFKKYNGTTVHIVTGFIASNIHQETTTLGRNGSNYTASLLASFLDAEELENFTHVDGIYTANPDLVPDAKKIKKLSFTEANELAHFGANVLHAKTIIPLLEKKIPLRILNTFDSENEGTLITSEESENGIKKLSVLENVSLISLEGRGLLGRVGVDARIFQALALADISIGIISQGSSERGIGFIVDRKKTIKAKKVLEEEFKTDIYKKDVNGITVKNEVSVISIIGQDLSTFHKPYNRLIKNQIVPLLLNNSTTGKNVSLVVHKKQLHKALNVIHGEIYGITKKINLAIFGHGLVGGTLIDQILKSTKEIVKRKNIQLNIFAIANSKKIIFKKEGINDQWETALKEEGISYTINDVICYADECHLENLIAIDNTASKEFIANYTHLITHGFDLVSSNKVANTMEYAFYKSLRNTLADHQKQYLYETNVGAGLPLIETIKLLHLSGENITRIKGVFSGSLSYLFNTFSKKDTPFSAVLREAMDSGFTEPDPREDLCGNDVGRKLLILARELDLKNEMDDIKIHNLIPEHLREGTAQEFIGRLQEFDAVFAQIKATQKEGHVLRYIGDLHGDLSKEKGILEVQLVSVPEDSSLGQVKGSDSIFEIYTASYGDHPMVIQGAGAGASVTARGVFGDILKVAQSIH